MKNKKLISVLDAAPFDLDDDIKNSLFKKNLLDELIYHYENNLMYNKFCKKNNFNPLKFSGEITEIPYIPVHVFKAIGHKLSSVSNDEVKIKLQSSATSGVPSTILLDSITARRQTIAMARVMKDVLGANRRPFCIMDIDPSSSNAKNLGARAAAVRGYLNFASSSNFFIDSSDQNKSLEFLEAKFLEYINSLKKDEPIVIFGFTFVIYHNVFNYLKSKNIFFSLPKGSKVIHIGGWKKLESKKVDKKVFNADVAEVLGIEECDIIDIYGFTEQMGLNYPDCSAGWKHVHSYSDVIVRDETDLSVVENGKVGLLQFISPLQHSYPGNLVLTDDLGVLEEGVCECGLSQKRFKILGRAKKAEIRGCGEVMSEKVLKKEVIKSVDDNIIVYHAPIKLEKSLKPIDKIDTIFKELKNNQKWLADQPTEAIIGLINLARKQWLTSPKLEKYRDTGLNFLHDWCDPARLSALLNSSLKGHAGHMDSFIPREDISHSSLKALPRGIVSHWLSGNVPLLGMFALIQSILTKNANILKVSANESQALPVLLETFKDLKYTTPGGYSIDGNELLKTLSVVYFDRNQTNIANTFSKNADVRIAWGGREAIESVCSLPKKYTCQDILYGPKISMMVIGKDALDSEKSIRKLVRRAATDCSVFDQYACASPHCIFIEKGGQVTPKEFAEKLSMAMEKALVRLPTNLPDVGQLNKIRYKIAEYGFIGEYWHDKNFTWTVLYDEDASLDDPTYQRVVTVKAVDNIYDVINNVNEDIQTVGLAMAGDKKLDFANKIMSKGAARCPDIGFMTHFDSPWDGIFAIDRLIRWVSLGGPI